MQLRPFDAYLEMESKSDIRHEWINGLVYAMSRSIPERGRLSAAVIRALPQTVECRVYSSDTLPYIEKTERSTYADASVVVEVLSKSTEQRDKNERFVVFQQLDSLEQYVLISQDERRVEVRTRVGRNWASEIRVGGETVPIHGHDIAADALYA